MVPQNGDDELECEKRSTPSVQGLAHINLKVCLIAYSSAKHHFDVLFLKKIYDMKGT